MKNLPKEVGVDKSKKSSLKLGYNDLPKDINGWVDAKEFLPFRYDLVIIDTGKRQVYAWWTGHRWDGFRVKDDTQPLRWKRGKEEE